MSRVVSAQIAALKADEAGARTARRGHGLGRILPVPGQHRRGGGSTASGVVIQPGGSMRDQEVIDAANEHGMAMLFTGMRHFRH